MGATAIMTGYIQWAPWWKFKPGDVVLNAGFFWELDDDGDWRILDALPGTIALRATLLVDDWVGDGMRFRLDLKPRESSEGGGDDRIPAV